ncbi:MAG TPA: IS3 family transposase [Candidatus Sulfotelmatobacter sp.]
MKGSRFSDEQIVGVLKEAEAGVPMKDLCRRMGISEATFYHWKAKYGGLEVSETRRLRQLEEENGRLKKIVAQQALDIDALKVVLNKKVVGPRAEREAVRVVREEAGLSERHACGLIGMHRGSWRYQRRERNEAGLRARLRELAVERPRFGYRRLYIFLRREKSEDGALRWLVNHKRVYRLYREEGLAMQRKRRKRFRAEARVPLALPTRANEVWTMDYTHDELSSGRKFRTLNLMDGYTREALRIEPDTSLPGLRVVRILESLRERRGAPAAIQVDNGTEFTSRVVDQWAYQNQVALHFIERGKPTQNALIESFNGKFRDECLNQNWFVDLRHAREMIEAWRVDYNTVRPHSSLRYLTPEEFAASMAARPASPPTPVVSIVPAWVGSDMQEPRSANL